MLNITIKSVEKVEKNKRATPYMWERAAFELNDSMQKKPLHSSYCLLLFLSF